jgi:hypothetical protein
MLNITISTRGVAYASDEGNVIRRFFGAGQQDRIYFAYRPLVVGHLLDLNPAASDVMPDRKPRQ